MSGVVLSVAEVRNGELRDVTLEIVGAGKELARSAGYAHHLAIMAQNASAIAMGLACEGVDQVLAVPTPTPNFEAHVAEAALSAVIGREDPDVVLLGHTIDSLGFGPALASRLELGYASDVTEIKWKGGLIAGRGAFGGKLRAELEFPGKACTLLMLRPGAFKPAGDGTHPEVKTYEVELPVPRTQHREFRESPPADVDITKAEFLLSIGRGIESEEELPRFERLADLLGATLSVSRPLVDAGWVSNARQVGQSGRTVMPKVYLALGISGAVQHLAGIRGADTIIAVNNDPEAPIFSEAHYGAVADLFDVTDALERNLGVADADR